MTFDVMNDSLVLDTWRRKYRYTMADGSSPEATVQDTRYRVVAGVYAKDKDIGARNLALDFVNLGILVPAGRVNAGAGLDRAVTLINCFISETVQDSMPGIQRVIARAALTMQQGGGIGTDYSPVRPRGAIVVRTGSISDGVIPFADQQNAMCNTIQSAGLRRGAMMMTLRDDHPDLWNERQFETMTNHLGEQVLKYPSFISAKRQRGRLTQFNVSVLVSDPFLKAIEADTDWDLGFHVPPADGSHVDVYQKPFPYDEINYDNEWNEVPTTGLKKKGDMLPWYVYRRVKARMIWEDIMRSTYTYAEPGLMFIDRINERNSLYYCEDIRCSNPCGEKPMPPNSICDLSSINLAFLVNEPFTANAEFDFERFYQAARLGVRFLDNVLDVTNYPLMAQKKDAISKRRIGLGVTGFGSMLVMMKIHYGSKNAVCMADKIGRALKVESYKASALLAKERGPFPLYDRDKYLKGYNVKTLPSDVQDMIATYGIRNGELNTIAPNGTISLYVGNVSSGHEPVFSFAKAKRKVIMDDGSLKEYETVDYSYRLYEHLHGPTPVEKLPSYFVGAMDLNVDEHLAVHAAWQKHIDASISKTVNIATEMPFEKFKEVYTKAYDMGCKGCTTYRYDPAAGRGSVLSEDKPKEVFDFAEAATGIKNALDTTTVRTRLETLPGMTYKLTWPQDGKNWYINVTNDGKLPMEMFITGPDTVAREWVTALSRTVTAVLRRGGDTRFLIEQLSEVTSATGGAMIATQQRFRPSIVAAIAGVLEREYQRLAVPGLFALLTPDQKKLVTEYDGPENHGDPEFKIKDSVEWQVYTDPCPECDGQLIREGGCKRCTTCGYNSCG